MNTIETATIIQSELDKAAVEQATSGWMEVNEKLVKYTGGAEVKIPSLDMDGMADYDRTNGFVQGSVNFQYETKKMTQDRGRSFSFDENDVDETNFVLTASTVMGEFQRTKVVPEIDAYRYSTIAAACIKKGKASGGYTADEATIDKICEALDCTITDLLEYIPNERKTTGKYLILEEHGNRKQKKEKD